MGLIHLFGKMTKVLILNVKKITFLKSLLRIIKILNKSKNKNQEFMSR